ncbi:putative dehydrogenase [Crossiella equi]|uniref:Dehydrogenase n=1 Tax=Crossiella equi TaxID=130796 RepID=A0ABS5AMW0_9PSEU|nr:Gfo/Idh/MocA family oxidoreductase [Crossiella equi]MBP2477915.1 putative dehydrogenase [Crossiella equi]
MIAARVALAGAHGRGRHHLDNVLRLQALGRVRLVAVCDPRGPGPLPAGVRHYRDLTGLLLAERPDITVLATPPHTHRDLTVAALRSGSDVLVETPPLLTVSTVDEMTALADEHGLAVQTGFQTLGSGALRELARLAADGALGELRGVAGCGRWRRGADHHRRAPWAGRRTLRGEPVLDGVLTNPFAHAVQSALVVAGAQTARPDSVELELLRAHDIEADDTACVRLRFPEHPDVLVAATLCAADPAPPHLVVHGRRRAVLEYERDTLHVDGIRLPVPPREDLLANLLDHREGRAELLAPLSGCRTFTEVVQAVGEAPGAEPVPADRVSEVDGGARVVAGVDESVRAAAEGLATFAELGAPWLPTPRWPRRPGAGAPGRSAPVPPPAR